MLHSTETSKLTFPMDTPVLSMRVFFVWHDMITYHVYLSSAKCLRTTCFPPGGGQLKIDEMGYFTGGPCFGVVNCIEVMRDLMKNKILPVKTALQRAFRKNELRRNAIDGIVHLLLYRSKQNSIFVKDLHRRCKKNNE